jgi:hypothetical protein
LRACSAIVSAASAKTESLLALVASPRLGEKQVEHDR